MCLLLEAKETAQPQALLSVREANNRRAVTEQRCDWSLPVRCIWYLCHDLWTEELAVEFALCSVSHSKGSVKMAVQTGLLEVGS